jgi:hypothetical protein
MKPMYILFNYPMTAGSQSIDLRTIVSNVEIGCPTGFYEFWDFDTGAVFDPSVLGTNTTSHLNVDTSLSRNIKFNISASADLLNSEQFTIEILICEQPNPTQLSMSFESNYSLSTPVTFIADIRSNFN